MIKPTQEQFGLTANLLVSLERERGDFEALKERIGRLVVLCIAVGVICAIAGYSVYGFDWPFIIPILLIGAVILGYLSPMVTAAILSRLDPHAHLHKLRTEFEVESITYRALWSSAYWDAFWKGLSQRGAWKDHLTESSHSRLPCLPDPGEELFLLAGGRYVFAIPRPSEPVNQEFADHLLKTVKLSGAQKGVICSDEDISLEVQEILKSNRIILLTSDLFLSSQVLRLAILQSSLPLLASATEPTSALLNPRFAKYSEAKLPFPPSMIRQAIAEELKECHDEILQTLLKQIYLILENFLPDEQGVQYEKLREFEREIVQDFRGMQEAGNPPREILKTVIALVEQLEAMAYKIDHTIDINLPEGLKKRLENIEVVKEVAAKNVSRETR